LDLNVHLFDSVFLSLLFISHRILMFICLIQHVWVLSVLLNIHTVCLVIIVHLNLQSKYTLVQIKFEFHSQVRFKCSYACFIQSVWCSNSGHHKCI